MNDGINNNLFIKDLILQERQYKYYSVSDFIESLGIDVNTIPYFIRIMIEMVLRKETRMDKFLSFIEILLGWKKNNNQHCSIPFFPSRVLLQDYTGIPLIADLAAMRDYVKSIGKKPSLVNPIVPTSLIVDHSVIAEFNSSHRAIELNMNKEFIRNTERYKFIKWGSKVFDNLTVIPPGNGIVHQINLEYLAPGINIDRGFVYPDSLVGTDSHTTMINSIGTVGWGVGGIEAESAMLGQPIYIKLPKIIGMKLFNKLRPSVTATDLVLSVTNILRHYGVVGDVVEFFGEGVKYLEVPDRATIANMAPEYGALMGLFGIDQLTLKYFGNTGKKQDIIELMDCYYKTQRLFDIDHDMVQYNHVVELDLSLVENCVAGPRRPEDKLLLNQVKYNFNIFKQKIEQEKKYGQQNKVKDKSDLLVKNGAVVIAAITSCTNTANPSAMIAAALLAKNALDAGLKCPNHVLKIFAPGSKVVEKYLRQSGLLTFLEGLGFYISAYGCTACIGNVGALNKDIEECIITNDLVVAAVLSGNRNYDARIHSSVRSNYLMSPPLVVAYALAGSVKIDLTKEPIGYSKQGPIFLKDIWPMENDVREYDMYVNDSNNYIQNYSINSLSNRLWDGLQVSETDNYDWNDLSTYIKQPPFFASQHLTKNDNINIYNLRALMILEDSITTDHISPAGKIAAYTPSARYLDKRNDNYYNTYGARRGNHEVMLLGAFSNPYLNNLLSSKKGQYTTKCYPKKHEGELNTIAEEYIKESTPTIIFAGYNYGTGSSRDWAAKATKLLGVKVVVAKSFERIHRSNLIYMGILPCQFKYPERIMLERYIGDVMFNLVRSDNSVLLSGIVLQLEIYDNKKNIIDTVPLLLRLDNDFEVNCYLKGGILPLAVENLLK